MTDIIDATTGTTRTPDSTLEVTESTTHRRAMIRKLALGGAGAAVGAVALSERASAGDSAGTATGGTAVELGLIDNTSNAPTGIQQSGALTDYSAFTVWEDDPKTIGTNVFPGAVGGYGSDVIANGVHGSTVSPAGFGVVAANAAPAADSTATPVPEAPAALAVASANGPQIKFVSLGTPVVGPTPGTHVPGEMYVDKDGTLWFTVPVPAVAPSTTAGVRFVKLAGTPTAGSLHTLPFPVRVSDSRLGTNPVKPAANSVTNVDLTKKVDASASGLPAGAKAALLNLTIANSDNKGFFSVAAAGVTTPAAALFSNGNWTQAGTNLGTSVTTAISADGKITITLGPEGGTHLIVDVVGYYL
jgi:hypothetical protein